MSRGGANCLIVAGEKSGEEHCLSFIDDLISVNPELSLWGVGGDELEKKGMDIHYHLNSFSSWGISEVIHKIPFYAKAMNHIVDYAKESNCKVAILIDFQTFNLKLARKLKKMGIKVFYYVAPQAWAWKSYRAKLLEESVEELFTIIPFEKKWFLDRGVKSVTSVDHPLWRKFKDELESSREKETLLKLKNKNSWKVTLLPGSRNFEVKCLLPTFIQTIKELKSIGIDIEVSIVMSSSVKQELYDPYLKFIDVCYKNEELSSALKEANFALAASGTVTLATALFQVPTVVCYQTSLLNEFIFDTFISYCGPISLANIVHQEEVFPELVQNRATSFNIKKILLNWMNKPHELIDLLTKLENTKNLVQGEEKLVGLKIGREVRACY